VNKSAAARLPLNKYDPSEHRRGDLNTTKRMRKFSMIIHIPMATTRPVNPMYIGFASHMMAGLLVLKQVENI
jgi:hypothetical protein